MEITVKSIYRLQGNRNLKGFATVESGPWTIRDCRVIQQPGQHAYVTLPQHEAPDGRFYPLIQCQDIDLKQAIQSAVLRVWNGDHMVHGTTSPTTSQQP
jgi:DNA-binding cell septation regulator SpoVG